MPSPYPQYQPEFTSEELAQARQVIQQHNAPHTLVVRAKMVLILSEAPKIGNAALADRAGVHYNTAWKWRKRWASGEFRLTDAPRSGRPSDFSPTANRSSQSNCLSIAGTKGATAFTF